MSNKQNILLGFYGDDFTGSTDALEFITRAGARTVLFIETPAPGQLEAFPGLQAFGVAGKTRALDPGAMEALLVPAFREMKATGARHIHYKVCSTFDSAPHTGSIGKAIDSGAQVFAQPYYPLIGAAPALGRYCLFGNLFARMGIGSQGQIYRLDRHPSMRKHPVTPSDESDLRLHIGRQTKRSIGLIDVVKMEKNTADWLEHVQEEIVVLDGLNDTHAAKTGAWLDMLATAQGQLFSAGSSGLEYALGLHWNAQGVLTGRTTWEAIQPVTSLLVVSGSCSPVTAAQIAWATAQGFEEIIINAAKVCETGMPEQELLDRVVTVLQQGRHVIVHTGTRQGDNLSSEKLGTALGIIAKHAVQQAGTGRVVISGGDTSSYAARAMEITAVEMIAPLVIGAPLCRVYSGNEAINGIEINVKGGQVGDERYFGILAGIIEK